MTRKTGSTGATKAIAASAVLSYNSTEIPSDGLLALHVSMSGAGGILGGTGLTRVIIKAGGESIFDVPAGHLIAWIQRFSRATIALVDGTSVQFTIPFNRPDAASEALADVVQFPPGKSFGMDLQFGAAGTGTCHVAWTYTDDVPAQFTPSLLCEPMGIPASSPGKHYAFEEPGEIVGITHNAANITQFRVVLGRDTIFDEIVLNSSLSEMQRIDGGAANNGIMCRKVNAGRNAPSGSSYVRLATGGSWAGTEEFGRYAMHAVGG